MCSVTPPARGADDSEWVLFDSPTSDSARSSSGFAGKVRTDPFLPPDARAEQHFWQHVIKTRRRCWYWVGAISSPDGYGRVTFRRANRQRSISAHRFALLIDDPARVQTGDVGEHWCNEPLCVRVDDDHVRLGTQHANLAYAVSLGRHQGPRPTATMDRYARSVAVRQFLLDGGDPENAVGLFTAQGRDEQQLDLF